MKYLFVLILFIGTNSFAQTKPTKKTPAKKAKGKQVYFGGPPKVIQPSYESDALSIPKAFIWQINADTTLAPKSTLKEIIEISNGQVVSRASFKDEEVVLKKSNEENYNVDFNFQSVLVQLSDYNSEINKNVLTLTDKETKAVRTFKIFYKEGKNINRLQDLKTKKYTCGRHLVVVHHPCK